MERGLFGVEKMKYFDIGYFCSTICNLLVPNCMTRLEFLEENRAFVLMNLGPIGVINDQGASLENKNTLDSCPNPSYLSPETQIPGSYISSCADLSQRVYKLSSVPLSISISQGLNGDGGQSTSTGRTGVFLWNSGLLLTRLLDKINERDSSFLRGRTVLELGMGVGLSSIAAVKMGAGKVIATDGNEEVLQLARENIKKNAEGDNIQVQKLMWGMLNAMDFYDEVDVVIGSDLTYNSGTWKLLAETVSTVLKPGGLFLYLSLGHAGFNVTGEIAGFLNVAVSEGMKVLTKDDGNWPLPNIPSLGDLLEANLNYDEKDILRLTGGVKVIMMQKK